MTDREVQAISQFLLRFGHLGCYQITVCTFDGIVRRYGQRGRIGTIWALTEKSD
jgi:hypothetical protein